jgi:hypothetical protein
MRKSPNRSKKRLWHGDDMVAAEDELEKGEAERQKWRRDEEEERRKAEELARQRAEEQARLLPHTKGTSASLRLRRWKGEGAPFHSQRWI